MDRTIEDYKDIVEQYNSGAITIDEYYKLFDERTAQLTKQNNKIELKDMFNNKL